MIDNPKPGPVFSYELINRAYNTIVSLKKNDNAIGFINLDTEDNWEIILVQLVKQMEKEWLERQKKELSI